ncbi:MAG: hypothetical protein L0027_03715 [Candidatus Rokubacteria bacterium]|nr:hypothetical protein [Candidatus Rokubacteria bacterium]
MAPNPFRTSLRRNPEDPRGLIERIEAQIRERIEEAVDMAALQLLVGLRQKEQRAAPQETSAADRAEFEALAGEVLADLGRAFRRALSPEEDKGLAGAEVGSDDRARALGGQVYLARRLPDYWQRFASFTAAYQDTRIGQATSRRSPLRRLFRG